MIITVDVTNPELDALEDVLVAWNLCPRHTEASARANHRQIVLWQYSCKSCRKGHAALVTASLRLCGKLCKAYDGKRKSKVERA